MDLTTVLREVDSWPVEDRMRLMEALWDGLLDAGTQPELTDAQRSELDRRAAALDANPDDVVPWEQVQQYLRRTR